jgi:hypothetical protein
MVYVWTGLAQAAGLRYYGIPGIGIPHTTGFNYIEPPEDQAFMREDEYDALIADPDRLPLQRLAAARLHRGRPDRQPATYRNNLALVKSDGDDGLLLRVRPADPAAARPSAARFSAIAGIFKAPFDIIADKLRGYIGLTMDMATQPDKVLKACEALMPHLVNVGLTTADPAKQVPIGFWMHRGCVPFITHASSTRITGPPSSRASRNSGSTDTRRCSTPRANGIITSTTFRELPERSILSTWTADDIFASRTGSCTTSSPSAAASPTPCSATAKPETKSAYILRLQAR